MAAPSSPEQPKDPQPLIPDGAGKGQPGSGDQYKHIGKTPYTKNNPDTGGRSTFPLGDINNGEHSDDNSRNNDQT